MVAKVYRYPRYKNKRSLDIYVRSYLDESKIVESPDWNLPVPNEEAAYKSLSKYAKNILAMDNEQVSAMNMAWEWTAKQFLPYMRDSRIKTLDEVIENLDMSTSSGFPFNQYFPTKRELFDGDPDIREFLQEDWNNILDDNYYFLFTNSLKEEIRPAEKTKLNKIRTFTAGAVDGTVQGARLFADMNERMNESYLSSSSGVGMSPLKGNWNLLYNKLKVFKNGYALDESEYDSSLRAYMMWGCARLRYDALRDEDRTIENLKRIRVYYRNLVNSLIITPEGVIVMKLGGNPSGSINTINDNTLILYTLLSYAWIMNCPFEPNYAEFEMNTAKILVGDDNTWTVSDWGHKFFNATSVISVWNKIGVTTTTESMISRQAEELDFLSAKTIFMKGMAIPVYSRSKLMTSLLYADTKSQSPAYTLLRAAALLQVGWSDVQFRRFCREFISWLLVKFDKTCAQDKDWIIAKSSILTDNDLEKLFLGTTEVLYPQSLNQESEKDINKPDKIMSGNIPTKKSQTRRGNGAKVTRQLNNNNNNNNRNLEAKKAELRVKMQNGVNARALQQVKQQQKSIPQNNFLRRDPTKVLRSEKENDMRLEAALLAAENNRLKEKQLRNREKKIRDKEKKKDDKHWYDYLWDIGKEVVPKVGSLLLGMGDYEEGDLLVEGEKPRTNSLLAAATKGQEGNEVPYMHETGQRVTVCHREYLGDIYSSTSSFSAIDFPLNPGMNETNPWLAPIANQYTSYEYGGLVAEFVSEGSEYTNSAGLGYVAMAVQYDSVDPKFNNKRDMLNSQFANAAKPSKSFQAWVECKRESGQPLNQLYVRSGEVPVGADKRMYDLGRLTVAVGGNTVSDVIIGELWLTYDISFFLPVGTERMAPNVMYAQIQGDGASDAVPLGATYIVNPDNTMQLAISGTEITFPKYVSGEFDLSLRWVSTVGISALAVMPTFTWSGSTGSSSPSGQGGFGANSGTTGLVVFRNVTLRGDGGVLTLSTAGIHVIQSSGFCSVKLIQVPVLSSIQDPSIFDRHGKAREERYSDFMGKILEVRSKDPIPDSLRKTKKYELFSLSESCFIQDLNTSRKYGCAPAFALSAMTMAEDQFDRVCDMIRETNSPSCK